VSQVKVRGYCDHSNFGGVGGAVPDRVNLFRAQMLRSSGGNAWRMAHNPPIPFRLDIMDRIGMLAMDENRDYGGHVGQGGITDETVEQEVVDMGDMVQRDRSHPSVMIWSFCNEVGCNNESSAALFRAISYFYDGSRGTTQNSRGKGDHPLSAKSLDVQGFSHDKSAEFDSYHKNNPTKPMMATECCSCLSQRGEDYDTCDSPRPQKCKDGNYIGHNYNLTCHHDCVTGAQKSYTDAFHTTGRFYNNEISQCTASQVVMSDLRQFVAGTFVWSGFDYIGESRGYPQTVKCRGTVADIAGFIKESYYWMRLWWFSKIDAKDEGRPPLAVDNENTVFIVESWRTGVTYTL
jgi:beta-galactosidase/beta-glucuronidase